MSLIEELGAVLYATSERMPVGEVAAALERLRAASALLMWIRQESSRPIGVPELAGATEHLEQAGRALHVAQESVAEYLTAIGLGLEGRRPPEDAWRKALDEQPDTTPEQEEPEGVAAPGRLGRWWAQRVTVLTDGPVDEQGEPGSGGPNGSTTGGKRAGDTTAGGTTAGGRTAGGRTTGDTAGRDRSGRPSGSGAGEPPELLRRVARHTRAGNRDALRRELTDAAPPVGLGLAAISPPVLHRLAGDLLGHQPRAADLAALTDTTRGPVHTLLPKLPSGVVDTLLARVCRVPPPRESGPPAHPADSAVTSAVLVGVLLSRLGRDPDSLRPDAPQPMDKPRQSDRGDSSTGGAASVGAAGGRVTHPHHASDGPDRWLIP
ncbi:hypothetical protein [Rugosimonospora africana]|uniref:Uncharacterized protein n=1 Tax=Rugosimonospora africana TaxID=556532 RepID=A0A8J3QXJ8_9ACTN|nr:hypothetical protein [Rugosimonospora africana]GIH16521.1 hypothetical protein Raf01_46930 [Rugosimonospora africana]